VAALHLLVRIYRSQLSRWQRLSRLRWVYAPGVMIVLMRSPGFALGR